MKTKQLMKYSPGGSSSSIRDDSPNSVIAHSAMLTLTSHPSSASGSMDYRRYSISDVETATSSKVEGVDDSADLDLESARLLVQKRLMSQSAKSAQSSPDHKPKNPKGLVQSGRGQAASTATNHFNEPHARFTTEQCLPTTYSFSAALKECQSRKLQTGVDVHRGGGGPNSAYEDLVRISEVISASQRFKERKRPASMELIGEICTKDQVYNHSHRSGSNVIRELIDPSVNQPNFCDLQKRGYDSQRSASGRVKSLPMSPDTPSRKGQGQGLGASANGNSWSMERVSMAANAHRSGRNLGRQGMPMRILPSKWDDAEKWLCSAPGDSPANAIHKTGEYYHRKPRSKSGPLAVMASASPSRPLYYSRTSASTAQGFYQSPQHIANADTENRMTEAGSRPGNAAAAVLDDLPGHQASENLQMQRRHTKLGEPELGVKSCIVRSASVDGWSFQAKLVPEMRITQAVPAAREPASLGHSIPEHCEPNAANEDTQSNLNRSQSAREILPMPIFSDMLTQDKYADTVLETPRFHGSIPSIKEEMVVVQTTKHGNFGSSMKDAATEISPTVSRRDMATQITPLGSSRTSRCTTPKKTNSPARHNTPARRSDSDSNTTLDVLELQLAKLDIADDPNQPEVFTPGKRLISSWSTREEEEEESSKSLKYFDVVGDWKKNIMEARAGAWEEAERSKCLARFKREEAKITAWENHQKAKAEAEMKKLEMKLEKLRSHSTEKIMNKLAAAQKKAEDMRVTLATQQAEQLAKTMERAASIRTKPDHVSTLGACFFM